MHQFLKVIHILHDYYYYSYSCLSHYNLQNSQKSDCWLSHQLRVLLLKRKEFLPWRGVGTYHAQHLGSEIDDHVDMTVHQQEEEPAGDAAPDGQVGQLQNVGQVTIYSTQPYKACT